MPVLVTKDLIHGHVCSCCRALTGTSKPGDAKKHFAKAVSQVIVEGRVSISLRGCRVSPYTFRMALSIAHVNNPLRGGKRVPLLYNPVWYLALSNG